MGRYSMRVNLLGTTQRERMLNRLKNTIESKALDSLSCKNVKLNGEDIQMVINSGTKPYYKEFQALPGQMVQMGDYIEWSERIWLVYEADSDNELYVDGKLYECNYQLYWQDDCGRIVSKWAFIQNASAYNTGEKNNRLFTLPTNQFMVWMPLDEDTLPLRNGKRMFIDNRTNEPSCYELTRPDTVSMKFGNKGCTYFIFSQCEINPETDEKIELSDGKSTWIADYRKPDKDVEQEKQEITCHIEGRKDLKIGFPRYYEVSFYDEHGCMMNAADIDFSWNIISSFGDEIFMVSENEDKTKISILIEDKQLIDEQFKLQILINNIVNSEMRIAVTSMY